eukprot:PhM_4_TR1519/c0_g1_i1/m.103046
MWKSATTTPCQYPHDDYDLPSDVSSPYDSDDDADSNNNNASRGCDVLWGTPPRSSAHRNGVVGPPVLIISDEEYNVATQTTANKTVPHAARAQRCILSSAATMTTPTTVERSPQSFSERRYAQRGVMMTPAPLSHSRSMNASSSLVPEPPTTVVGNMGVSAHGGHGTDAVDGWDEATGRHYPMGSNLRDEVHAHALEALGARVAEGDKDRLVVRRLAHALSLQHTLTTALVQRHVVHTQLMAKESNDFWTQYRATNTYLDQRHDHIHVRALDERAQCRKHNTILDTLRRLEGQRRRLDDIDRMCRRGFEDNDEMKADNSQNNRSVVSNAVPSRYLQPLVSPISKTATTATTPPSPSGLALRKLWAVHNNTSAVAAPRQILSPVPFM